MKLIEILIIEEVLEAMIQKKMEMETKTQEAREWVVKHNELKL
jgi:hypothetical protein